jgi:hypothetical protein
VRASQSSAARCAGAPPPWPLHSGAGGRDAAPGTGTAPPSPATTPTTRRLRIRQPATIGSRLRSGGHRSNFVGSGQLPELPLALTHKLGCPGSLVKQTRTALTRAPSRQACRQRRCRLWPPAVCSSLTCCTRVRAAYLEVPEEALHLDDVLHGLLVLLGLAVHRGQQLQHVPQLCTPHARPSTGVHRDRDPSRRFFTLMSSKSPKNPPPSNPKTLSLCSPVSHLFGQQAV